MRKHAYVKEFVKCKFILVTICLTITNYYCLLVKCHALDPVYVEMKKKMKTVARNSNRDDAKIYQIYIFGTLKTVSSSMNKESVKQIIKRQKKNLF